MIFRMHFKYFYSDKWLKFIIEKPQTMKDIAHATLIYRSDAYKQMKYKSRKLLKAQMLQQCSPTLGRYKYSPI